MTLDKNMKISTENIRAAFLILSLIIAPIVSAGTGDIRILNVKVVGDQNFARQDAWQRRAAEYIEAGSKVTVDLLGIRLRVIDYELWTHSDDANGSRLTGRMLNEIRPGAADAIIGFTLLPRPSGNSGLRSDGVTMPFRGILIRTYQGADDGNMFVPYVICHEVAHLFGAIHVDDNTLMTPAMTDTVLLTLDPINAGIVDVCREINFADPLKSFNSSQVARLIDFYEKARQSGHYGEEVGYFLGMLYPLIGRYDQALPFMQKALDADSSSAINWLQLGECYYKTSREDAAAALLQIGVQHALEKGQIYRQLAYIYFNKRNYDLSGDNARRAEESGTPMDTTYWREMTKVGRSQRR
jgi:tetratricopeptide (TPR) repeat protein